MMRSNRLFLLHIIAASIGLMLASCSPVKHVPQGSLLLEDVRISLNDSTRLLNKNQLSTYLRSVPNSKLLWSTKFRLGLYNLSGKDSTKWFNRTLRRMGEPPAIYDAEIVENDAEQLRRAMVNAGFLDANVDVSRNADSKKRSMKVTYNLHPGKPHVVKNIRYVFPDDSIKGAILEDSLALPIKKGVPLDISILEKQRDRITEHLRHRGYYAVGRDVITFTADTVEGSKDVDLTMIIHPPRFAIDAADSVARHKKYIIRSVRYITNYDPGVSDDISRWTARDTVDYKGLTILYGKHKYLRPDVLKENCFLTPGEFYNIKNVNDTYSALGRLNILKFINIRILPAASYGDYGTLDVFILLTPAKSQTLAADLEGTNSEGDFGMATGITYTHRNIGKGSETLTIKVRTAYEALNGDFTNIIRNRYLETSGEASLAFPKFKAPLLSENFKKRIKATTDITASMNYQERPEYIRIISTIGCNYKWTERYNHNRHVFTPIDINYVYLPESTNNFLDQIAPDNPLLRYSYEDHFIMRIGYSFYHSNKRPETPWYRSSQRNIFTIRVNAEAAGNALYAFNSIFTYRSNHDSDPYKVFGIPYSQYIKGDGDFSFLRILDSKNSLAFHVGSGIGYPYGNSTILPFEKRFFGGGANGVRGWQVRTLGPGSYPGSNSMIDFINQCGDIRLDMSVEYRAKLFWILEGALFIDAGNIWTIKNYPNQPGGVFKFDSFYRQIAAAYGGGIRLDFSYFLLRFDLGMKAHNPAQGALRWPLLHPNWGRDASFHFSIGYPF